MRDYNCICYLDPPVGLTTFTHYCIPPFYVLCPYSYFVRTQKTWNNFLFTIHDDLFGFSHWKQICAKSFSGKIHRAAVPLCVISSLFRAGSSSRLLHTIRKFFFSALLQPVRVSGRIYIQGNFYIQRMSYTLCSLNFKRLHHTINYHPNKKEVAKSLQIMPFYYWLQMLTSGYPWWRMMRPLAFALLVFSASLFWQRRGGGYLWLKLLYHS